MSLCFPHYSVDRIWCLETMCWLLVIYSEVRFILKLIWHKYWNFYLTATLLSLPIIVKERVTPEGMPCEAEADSSVRN